MRDADESLAPAMAADRPRAVRGRPGFFRVQQDGSGRWWLLDSGGQPFFLRAVHGVGRWETEEDRGIPHDSTLHLRARHFNALGVGSDSELRADGLPFLSSVDFCDAGPAISAPGVRLPDVFDPEWPARSLERARVVCAPLAGCRELIGWVPDAKLEWAGPSEAGRPSLLQLCLSLEPSFAAYHAAWEFVLAHHSGRLDMVASAWNARLPNKETVRELMRAEEGLGTRGYLRDDGRWVREFALRYFGGAAAAIRQADSNHLVFGSRCVRPAGPAVLGACAYPVIDVTMAHWSELPLSARAPNQPLLADGVNWAAPEFLRAVTSRRGGRLTTVERMLRKARTSLERMARHPAVIGYSWAQWRDEPAEQPPFAAGLVHANGAEAREHTELLGQFNLRAEALHREVED